MQTVNFFLPVNIPTGHPTFENPSLWIGRAIITQENDYDDSDQPFTVDMAEITDLFFLPYAGADVKTARRVELPQPSLEGKAGFTFRFQLEQAAIMAYHNPQLQPGEMPDDERCLACNKNNPNPLHSCPYKEDINGDSAQRRSQQWPPKPVFE